MLAHLKKGEKNRQIDARNKQINTTNETDKHTDAKQKLDYDFRDMCVVKTLHHEGTESTLGCPHELYFQQ